MRIKALRTFNHDQLGRVEKGQEVDDVTPAQLSGIRKYVEIYETKVIHQEPEQPKKPEPEKSSASPVDPASQKPTATRSKRGVRRRKTG